MFIKCKTVTGKVAQVSYAHTVAIYEESGLVHVLTVPGVAYEVDTDKSVEDFIADCDVNAQEQALKLTNSLMQSQMDRLNADTKD